MKERIIGIWGCAVIFGGVSFFACGTGKEMGMPWLPFAVAGGIAAISTFVMLMKHDAKKQIDKHMED